MLAKKRLGTVLAIILATGVALALCGGTALADSWVQVASGGIDNNFNQLQREVTSMVSFGANLYAGTDGPGGCQVWRTADGLNWTQVNVDGFGDDDNMWASSMAVFGADLYVGTFNPVTGCEVWRSPDGTSWTQVVGGAVAPDPGPGFGNANNLGASSMVVTPGGSPMLVVGTYNNAGCEMFASADGANWIGTVIPPGFASVPPGNNVEVSSLTICVGGGGPFILAGTMTGAGGPGCEVWLNTGVAWPWTCLAGSGPGALLAPGFGAGGVPNPANTKASSMVEGIAGFVFVGVANNAGCEVWMYNAGGAVWQCQVGVAGLFQAGGFGQIPLANANNVDVDSMAKDAGGNIYACTTTKIAAPAGPGCEVWYSGGGPGGFTCAAGAPAAPPPPFTPPGFGNPSNISASAIGTLGANIYVGTRNWDNGCEVWSWPGPVIGGPWTPSTPNFSGFAVNNNTEVSSGALFGATSFAGTRSGKGCEIYTSTDNTNWVQSVGSQGAGPTAAGFGNPFNESASSMAVFGSNIYAGTENTNTGCEVWRSPDGITWTPVVSGGTSGFANVNNVSASSMAVFNNYLYVGTYNMNGCELWRSVDGTAWTQVAGAGGVPPDPGPGFGNANNWQVSSMTGYQGTLYAGTWNPTDGCEAYTSPDGLNWTCRVGIAGAGRERDAGFGPLGSPNANNTTAGCMTEFLYNITLFVGVDNSTGGCELWQKWGPAGAWTRPVSGGFGDANNTGASSMTNFGRRLVVGTSNQNAGCQVWRSFDGGTWTQATTQGGFGDADNTRAAVLIPDGVDLCVGTSNGQQGAEIYRERVSISLATPSSGYQGQRLEVVIDGTNTGFSDGSVPDFGAGITVNGTAFTNETRITADITIQNTAAPGARNVNVTTGNETCAPLVSGFTVTDGTPNITSLSPDNGYWGTEVTIAGANFQASRGTSTVTFGTVPVTDYLSWGDNQIKVRVPSNLDVGKADVKVTTAIAASNTRQFTVNPAAWFLAEGSTAWGFNCYISIENPNDTAVNCEVLYMTSNGPVPGGTVYLPGKSQLTVFPANTVGQTDFSTFVRCLEGKPIAVDRTMTWTGGAGTSGAGTGQEAHNSVGVTSPAKTWYLPEGSSRWGFETWLLIQNPDPVNAATCTVTYMIEGEGPRAFEKTVPASTRKTYNMNDDIGEKDASIQVTSNVAVIPERAMYRHNKREGHDSIGSTTPATDYFLAEGTTAWGFTTYVLVQNPNPAPTDVTVTYMTPQGPKVQAPFQMPANSRKTIRVNDVEPDTDLSTWVHGSQPILAERAMYWMSSGDEICHDSIGMPQAHTTFYLPDGQTSEGRETWTLVQNPNGVPVEVEISYLAANATGNVTFTDTVPANSRKTYSMADMLPNISASILVTSKTPGAKIMCERAMYWNSRGAGTDTIGGYSD